LSEAWYRALYGTRPKAAQPQTISQRAASPDAAAVPDASAAAGKSTRTVRVQIAAEIARRARPTLAVAAAHRVRGDRLAPARPAVHAWRAALARRTICRLPLSGGGSVDLLLQQRGRRLHVVAIATGPPGTAQHVGDALRRARAALAAHGLRLDIDSREKGPA
jgi:hypothetical protein